MADVHNLPRSLIINSAWRTQISLILFFFDTIVIWATSKERTKKKIDLDLNILQTRKAVCESKESGLGTPACGLATQPQKRVSHGETDNALILQATRPTMNNQELSSASRSIEMATPFVYPFDTIKRNWKKMKKNSNRFKEQKK